MKSKNNLVNLNSIVVNLLTEQILMFDSVEATASAMDADPDFIHTYRNFLTENMEDNDSSKLFIDKVCSFVDWDVVSAEIYSFLWHERDKTSDLRIESSVSEEEAKDE